VTALARLIARIRGTAPARGPFHPSDMEDLRRPIPAATVTTRTPIRETYTSRGVEVEGGDTVTRPATPAPRVLRILGVHALTGEWTRLYVWSDGLVTIKPERPSA
jgi:hypothetical protein